MRTSMFLIALWFARTGVSYTLPVDFIISEVAKHTFLAKTINFQGAITTNDETRFIDLVLKDSSLNTQLPLFFFSELLKGRGKSHINSYLVNAGIDMTIVSHGIFSNEPVFIIGALPSNNEAPQLWIDKATFLPVKEISKDGVVTFEKWIPLNIIPKLKFPRIIKIVNKGVSQMVSISEKN